MTWARRARWAGCVCGAVLVAFSQVGCAGGGDGAGGGGVLSTAPNPGTTASATGDWNDITAAVFYAATKAEMAMIGNGPDRVEAGEDGSLRVIYTLYTIRDARVRLQITNPDGAETGTFEATCSVGSFEASARERLFLDAFARRLAQLQGVDSAPSR